MKKKIIILILSHGGLAEELIKTAEMISGKIEDIYYLNLMPKISFESFSASVVKLVNENSENDILVFIDLFGGSCFNVCSKIIKQPNVKVVSGINLPLLLEAIYHRNEYELEQLAEYIISRSQDSIINVSERIKK